VLPTRPLAKNDSRVRTSILRAGPQAPHWGPAPDGACYANPRHAAPLSAAAHDLLRHGALGLVTIAEAFWIKEALTLTPAELAAIGVWLTLPWTIKMIFVQLVDSVLGSERRAYVYIGACLVATGLSRLLGRPVAGSLSPARTRSTSPLSFSSRSAWC